jgi:hypothetical protein
MISTSAIIGTGLKKCTPMKRSGCSMLAASWVTDSDEVLVAIRQSAADVGGHLLQDALLELQVLGGGLDHQLRAGQLA